MSAARIGGEDRRRGSADLDPADVDPERTGCARSARGSPCRTTRDKRLFCKRGIEDFGFRILYWRFYPGFLTDLAWGKQVAFGGRAES